MTSASLRRAGSRKGDVFVACQNSRLLTHKIGASGCRQESSTRCRGSSRPSRGWPRKPVKARRIDEFTYREGFSDILIQPGWLTREGKARRCGSGFSNRRKVVVRQLTGRPALCGSCILSPAASLRVTSARADEPKYRRARSSTSTKSAGRVFSSVLLAPSSKSISPP